MNFFLTDHQLLEELLEAASNTPVQQLPRLAGRLAEANAVVLSRLQSPTPALQADELIDIKTASARLGLSTAYLYRHSDQLPFTIRQGRKLLFSTAGISKYIQTKTKGR
jgi:predicted DNA-binding transcriptional regulator AlpA